jgi:hypothetical protein
MRGAVNPFREPVLDLRLRALDGTIHEFVVMDIVDGGEIVIEARS